MNRKYKFMLIVLISISSVLIFKNYTIAKHIKEKNYQLQVLKERSKKVNEKDKKFGYTETIDAIKKAGETRVLNFSNSKDSGTISVSVEILGNSSLVHSGLENIEKSENFYSIDDITIKEASGENMKATANINFKSNK